MYSLFLRRKRLAGYTLIEIVSALGAFTIIMLVVVQIFARGFTSYREIKKTQINLEAAQFALNLIAKEIRTSSVVVASPGGASSRMVFYDYSQGRCIEYVLDQTGGTIARRAVVYSDPDPNVNRSSCVSHTFSGSAETILSGLTGQAISVITSVDPSPDPRVGKVTVSVTVGQGSAATSLQTTVSLRDFNYTGT